uniref:Uncharacterized protein n=1 Tax=Anguilla anguilla TaxID=7936 RepID=A0A0E9TYT3_ANGAN
MNSSRETSRSLFASTCLTPPIKKAVTTYFGKHCITAAIFTAFSNAMPLPRSLFNTNESERPVPITLSIPK